MKFRVGIAPPVGKATSTDPVKAVLELMQMCKDRNMNCMSFPSRNYEFTDAALAEVAAAKKEWDFGFTVGCPNTIFKYSAGDKSNVMAAVEKSMKTAKALGEKYVRPGYGHLDLRTTRFNLDIPLDEHIKSIADGLKSIVPMAEEYDLDIVLENHCDFTGQDLAKALDMVNSPRVGIFIDTGNCATVWNDPISDNEAMWPYMKHAGHVKDVKGILDPEYQGENKTGRFPVQLVACYLGEGMVPIKGMIDYLKAHSAPDAEFNLQIECLWTPEGFNMSEYMSEGVKYLWEITK